MAEPVHLLIFGASARAAAFSALRAGLLPWCADLFADADLAAQCSVQRVPGKQYPAVFLEIVRGDMPGPWMYTGALENAPFLIARLSRLRPLWGNNEHAVALARNPWRVMSLLKQYGLPAPQVWWADGEQPPEPGRWLLKPRRSAGGRGIRFWDGAVKNRPCPRGTYWQEYIEGQACAAVYVGAKDKACLLGVTRQLVGEDWLHAQPFHYCGSIGPLILDSSLRAQWEQLGDILTTGCRLCGFFGVDGILRNGVPYPVEINPRYTASVEVLEYATGLSALSLHRGVFDPRPILPAPLAGKGLAVRGRQPASSDPAPPTPFPQGEREEQVVGKAILFAREPLTFPADGPWLDTLRQPFDPWQLPAFADLPHPGEHIDAGRPVLTFFARAASVTECEGKLRDLAADLDRWLWDSASVR